MKFVAIDTDIAGDRVTYALAAELGVSRRDAVGILTLFYAGVAKHADDGNLSAILDEQIEDWCLWSGARGELAILLRTHLCDLSGVIRRWEDWNGAMIRKAKQDRERKRLARAVSAERPRNVRGQSTDAGADSPRNGAGTVPDLTVPNQTTKTTTQTTTSCSSEKLDEPVSASASKAKPERKYPHFPLDFREALYERWREKGGILVEFPRFVREVAVLFDRPEAEWGFTRREALESILVAREWALATDRIARNNFESGNLTPGRWAGAFRSTHLPNVRMGVADRDGIVTAFGALIDRGCAAAAA